MKKIIVASQNPVKVNATKIAFESMFPNEEFEVEGVKVDSGVSNQPMSNDETLLGAKNRANNAKKYEADFWVGIEGGLEKVNDEMETFAWIVVESSEICGKSRTGTFFLPKGIVELIDSGKELGEADDIIFKGENLKQKNGAVGMLTQNLIDRTKYYTEAIVLALIPFKNSDMY